MGQTELLNDLCGMAGVMEDEGGGFNCDIKSDQLVDDD